MQTSVYIVCVYEKATDTMIGQVEFKPDQMEQYEACVSALDLSKDHYYDVEVVRV